MDPLDVLRGEVARLDPLQRAWLHGQAQEAREEREQELRRAEAADRAEYQAVQREALERLQIARDGHSEREVSDYYRGLEDLKRERIRELEDELERLDPKRAQVQRSVGTDEQRLAASREAGANQVVARFRREAREREEAVRRRDLAAAVEHIEQEYNEIARWSGDG
jgi:hypothetical protein